MLNPALAEAIDRGRHDLVITSGRRLARAIDRHVAAAALDRGQTAWTAPTVLTWQVWLRRLADARVLLKPDVAAPDRVLTPPAARQLWRDAVAASMPAPTAPLANVSGVAALAADAYAVMRRYGLTLDAVAAEAFDDDSRCLVDSARRVRSRLAASRWMLEADLAGALAADAATLLPDIGARVLLAGFDALTPDQEHLIAALPDVQFDLVTDRGRGWRASLARCGTFRDEIVAAGRWARGLREERPDCRIAVVVPGLSGIADDVRRWFRQGFAPPAAVSTRVGDDDPGFEMSYGGVLRRYPAVATALALLEFSVRPRSFVGVSRLLRTPLLQRDDDRAACALEARLRARPDRPWLPAALTAFAAGDAPAWLEPVRALAELAEEKRRPSAWAEAFESTLSAAGWLDAIATDSPVFQLRRAFHGALNALGALDPTAGSISLDSAVSALGDIAGDTLFQPEGDDPDVLVCGPLEMPGLGFDAVWVAGLDAGRWPAPGRPNALLPRGLQRRHALPDATPEQTAAFWRRRFDALSGAAPVQVLSHAEREGDSELLPSPLLDGVGARLSPELADGRIGWADVAATLPMRHAPDTLSRFAPDRRLYQAATALPLLRADPFAAMALGRWNARWLEDPRREVGPRLRGELLHEALRRVYLVLDSRDAIAALAAPDRLALVRREVADAMAGAFVHADEVVRTLLRIEEARAVTLIDALLDADLERTPFEVVAREQERVLTLSGITLHLKLDRVDRTADGSVVIDYKTGSKVALTRDSIEGQHFAMLLYALTEREAVAGVAMAALNREPERYSGLVDDGARGVLPASRLVRALALPDVIDDWRADAEGLAARFLMAPVDIGRHPEIAALNWLSRYAEARRDAR